jgi:hypothetical protein
MAMFSFLLGEQLKRFGINTAPAAAAEVERKKFLREIDFI